MALQEEDSLMAYGESMMQENDGKKEDWVLER